MEERCEKFYQDSCKGINTKEIQSLRKFLFKNQNYRFTDGQKTKLFQAIETHCNQQKKYNGVNDESLIGLLEDALAMPFTVFNTSQKNKLLKIYENFGQILVKQSNQPQKEYMVLDITKDGFLSLMNDKGISRDDIKIEAKDFNLIKESLDNEKEIIAIVINDQIQKFEIH